MELQWYVVVDWGKSEHQVCLLNTIGEHVAERKIPHAGNGFTELAIRLSVQMNQAEFASIGVALETSSGPVVECLLALVFGVFAINPKKVDRFRDRYSPAGAKDDRCDALVLASALFLEPQALQILKVPDADMLELRERHRRREQLQRAKQGSALKIRQCHWSYYPHFESLFGPDIGLPFVQALWEHMPKPEAARHRRKNSVEKILNVHKIRRFQAGQVLEQLRAQRLPVPTTTAQLLQEQITLLFQQLALVHQQLQEAMHQLETKRDSLSTKASTTSALSTNPPRLTDRDILASMPGVGIFVLANLLGEAGVVIRNRDYVAWRCLAGIAPVTKRSGKSRRIQSVAEPRTRGPSTACTTGRASLHKWIPSVANDTKH